MGKFANFYDGVSALLDKLADKIDPGKADVKSANYSTSVLNSLERISDNYELPESKGVIRLYIDSSGYVAYKSGNASADRVLWDDFIALANTYVIRMWADVVTDYSTLTNPGECICPYSATATYVGLLVMLNQDITVNSQIYAWGIAQIDFGQYTSGGKKYAKRGDTYIYGVPYPYSGGGDAPVPDPGPVDPEDPMVG